jgi:esterase/lipase superfamily enzyme
MCEWGEEDNEQLNRMKVSDVEGDKNVSGVFQAWDDDDDTYTNDFYCAMTGDFIIRIAEGVTVERGDLLMSAGDGTAKPQDDDIIRSKTIAKVTSTNVSCTYEDGSYCVPCVLMAC